MLFRPGLSARGADAHPLTFLSDRVLEVRNLFGELFGFERTAAAPLAEARSMLVTNSGLFFYEGRA
jgi:hypothetical protein